MYFETRSKDQLAHIYGEFDTTEELVRKNVDDLISWVAEQEYLPNVDDVTWMTNILLRCKNNMERAQKHLEQYYIGRAEYTDIFSHRDPRAKEMQDCFKVTTTTPAPALTPDGYRITYFKISKHTGDMLPKADVLLSSYQIHMDLVTKLDLARGYIIVVDFRNMSMAFQALSFVNLRRTLMMATKINKFRIHKIYMLYVTPILEVLINVAKKMVKKDLAERFLIWSGNSPDLSEVVPRNILSVDYGGEGVPVKELRELWMQEIINHSDWLQSEKEVKADLSKKPKTKNNKDSFFRNWW